MNNPVILPFYFQYIAAAVGFCFAIVPYISLVLKRQIRPNLSTWLIWGLAPLLSVLVSVLSGVNFISLIVLFVAGVGPLLIILAAILKKQFYLESKLLDIVCVVFALVGLAIYFLNDDVLLSQIILIVVDLIAYAPLIIKVWFSKNENEPIGFFLVSILVTLVALLTQETFSISASLFLFYLVIQNILTLISVILKIFDLKSRGI